MNHYHYAWHLVLMGRLDEAIVEHELAQALDALNPLHAAWLGGLYEIGGNYDAAFRWLEFQPRYAWVPWARVLQEFADLRRDPRFQDFLRQFKLPLCNGTSCARTNESGHSPPRATQARTST